MFSFANNEDKNRPMCKKAVTCCYKTPGAWIYAGFGDVALTSQMEIESCGFNITIRGLSTGKQIAAGAQRFASDPLVPNMDYSDRIILTSRGNIWFALPSISIGPKTMQNGRISSIPILLTEAEATLNEWKTPIRCLNLSIVTNCKWITVHISIHGSSVLFCSR